MESFSSSDDEDETNPENKRMENLANLLFHKMKNDGIIAKLERLEEEEAEKKKIDIEEEVILDDHPHALPEDKDKEDEGSSSDASDLDDHSHALSKEKDREGEGCSSNASKLPETKQKYEDSNKGKEKYSWNPPTIAEMHKHQAEEALKASRLDALQKETSDFRMLSARQKKKLSKSERAKLSSKGWGGMHAKEEPTDEEKLDLMVLKMRGTVDTQRHYKHTDIKAPKFFQFGTIVSGAQDFHHRIPKKKRKATMVEELMADMEFRKKTKKNYLEVMETKRQGKAAYQTKPPKRKKKTK
ncbi:deoxynucleotidyltransferase terminal-interacting protein 2-like [Pomacea canaliculata]|uniref:deoxynucleotidyltransferase terminal-interacting protein 2-like n=1 Tax=Pomacea canaliculata TaxID=400727 RepID=UPI000D72F0FE|nr:deoxynucleotidyltransferase terminal-interacting protein 2-like [Pomacea canaliculata]